MRFYESKTELLDIFSLFVFLVSVRHAVYTFCKFEAVKLQKKIAIFRVI